MVFVVKISVSIRGSLLSSLVAPLRPCRWFGKLGARIRRHHLGLSEAKLVLGLVFGVGQLQRGVIQPAAALQVLAQLGQEVGAEDGGELLSSPIMCSINRWHSKATAVSSMDFLAGCSVTGYHLRFLLSVI